MGSSLEESITSSLVESSSTLLTAGGYFAGRGAFFLAETRLEVHLSAERVEARRCGGGMEVGGGAEVEAGETMEPSGAGGGGGAVGTWRSQRQERNRRCRMDWSQRMGVKTKDKADEKIFYDPIVSPPFQGSSSSVGSSK